MFHFYLISDLLNLLIKTKKVFKSENFMKKTYKILESKECTLLRHKISLEKYVNKI